MPDAFECLNIWGRFSNRLSFNSQERFWSLFHQVVERSKISPKNRLPILRKMTIWSQNQSFCHWVRISSVTRFFRRLRRRRRQSRSAPRSERTLLRGSNTGVNNWSEGPISKHPNIQACNISRVLRKIARKHSITSPESTTIAAVWSKSTRTTVFATTTTRRRNFSTWTCLIEEEEPTFSHREDSSED